MCSRARSTFTNSTHAQSTNESWLPLFSTRFQHLYSTTSPHSTVSNIKGLHPTSRSSTYTSDTASRDAECYMSVPISSQLHVYCIDNVQFIDNDKIKIAHLNVSGWTVLNHNLRESIIISLDSQIVSIKETHLINDAVIHVLKYIWYGHNRKNLHVNAPKGSGGVGFLVHNTIFQRYDVNVIDQTYEGILVLKLAHRYSYFTFCIASCYLPPENSPWGRDGELFYSHILSLMYNMEYENFIICGDLNSRIGNMSDYINDVDNVAPREILDKHVNQHGKCLIDFLLEAKMCILNGRISPENNNYTSKSTKGISVVDYFIVPHSNLSCFENFTVTPCLDIIEKHNLFNLLNHKSRTPDHAALSVELKNNLSYKIHIPDLCFQEKSVKCHKKQTFVFKNIPVEFCNNNYTETQTDSIINRINANNESKEDINSIYTDICSMIYHELDNYLQIKPTNKNCRKRTLD